jgi:hypothetical protein
MQESFRCLGCGAASASATVCAHCGGRSFSLVPPPEARGDQRRMAQLVSLEAVRAERSRNRRD